MKAKEIYVLETGNEIPDNQIAYIDWHSAYIKWLEKQVEILYNSKL